MKKNLYTFNWNEGGFNQVYAHNLAGAKQEIRNRFSKSNLTVNLKTLKVCKDEKGYWASLPLMD